MYNAVFDLSMYQIFTNNLYHLYLYQYLYRLINRLYMEKRAFDIDEIRYSDCAITVSDVETGLFARVKYPFLGKLPISINNRVCQLWKRYDSRFDQCTFYDKIVISYNCYKFHIIMHIIFKGNNIKNDTYYVIYNNYKFLFLFNWVSIVFNNKSSHNFINTWYFLVVIILKIIKKKIIIFC